MTNMIIGICGLIGSGKGTVADVLVDQGFKKVSFADRLKDGVSTIFGWDRAMLEGDTDESRQWREQRDDFWSAETKWKSLLVWCFSYLALIVCVMGFMMESG